jgi:DNA adenine methylase
MNDENAFIYLDPPYFNAEFYYNAKFGLEDHKHMLSLLKQAKAKWLLSGYANDLYDAELKDFYRVEIPSVKPSYGITEANKHLTNERPKALEILWANYEIKL